MAVVKFVSIDDAERTVTMDVDGVEVVRNVPNEYAGTIDDYIKALAAGLVVEAEVAAQPKTQIETPVVKSGEILVDSSEEDVIV
tara:strand:+ start:1767 stop:2018 length:252 start_codon:yes stop_codon:yes gene_type:complete